MTNLPTLAQQAADTPNARARVAFVAANGGWSQDRWFGGHVVGFPDGSLLVIRGGEVESPRPTFVPMMPITPRSWPLIISASKAPTPAEGKVERIVSGWMVLSWPSSHWMR